MSPLDHFHLSLSSIGLESSLEKKENKPNLIVFQITGSVPFSIDIAFESDSHVEREESLTGEKYTRLLSEKELSFDLKFEQIFQLTNKGRAIPSRILRELHESDRTEWRLQA